MIPIEPGFAEPENFWSNRCALSHGGDLSAVGRCLMAPDEKQRPAAAMMYCFANTIAPL